MRLSHRAPNTQCKVLRTSFAENLDQVRIHITVLIRNAENDQPLLAEQRAEHLVQLLAMRLFHHKDDVCPVDEVGTDWIRRIRVRSRRQDFEPGLTGEDCLRRWTPKLILATDEQYFEQI